MNTPLPTGTNLAFRPAGPQECQAYLQGALHDGTCSHRHRTHRIAQKGTDWLHRLSHLLADLGHKSWLYQEGKDRGVYVLETSAAFLDVDFDPDLLDFDGERRAYVRGYFDAEGGLPQCSASRFYIQFTQKDHDELAKVRKILEQMDIACGKLHVPSVRVDPDYWRFYVRAQSYQSFAAIIGSWHPRKEMILQSTLGFGHAP